MSQQKKDRLVASGDLSDSGSSSSTGQFQPIAKPLVKGPVVHAPDNTAQASQSAGKGDATADHSSSSHSTNSGSGAGTQEAADVQSPSGIEGGEPEQETEAPREPLPLGDPGTGTSTSQQPQNQGGGESAPAPTTTAGEGGPSSGTVTSGEGGTQGSIQPTTSTPTDFGSVGGGQVKGEEEAGLNKLSRLVWCHKAIIMSYTLNAVCLVMLGMVFVERPCPESMVQVITDRVVSNDSVLGEAVLEKYFQREDAGKRIVREVIPALRDEAQKVNITVVKQKRLEYGCLVSMEKQWQQFKRDLEKAEEELERKYRKKLEKEMEAFALTYRQKLIAAQADFDKEMSKTKVDINSRLHKNQETVSHTVDDRINTETEKLNKRMEDISTTLGLRDKLLEVQGFLKIDSIGPVLVILGVVEALLSVCICMLFGRSFSGAMASRPPRQQRGANADQVPNGGNTVQRQQQQQPPPININNSNVVALCFRNADEKLSRRLGAKLVDSCSSSRGLQLRTYVVNSMEDVPEIPACRAVLVFVDPDEREMIIEDERYHIGQGLRRHALQRLMDSGVEVFIIIFNDQMSVTLNAGELYNSKLGQVDEHAQLKRLKRKDRVVSIKDQFHQHQTSLIVGQLNSVFG